MRTILFVCTGNTCRSPMAEAIARHVIADGLLGKLPDLFVASAGISAASGSPPTANAVDALEAMGVELTGTSKPLTAEMVRKADYVFGMTDAHVQAATRMMTGDGGPKIMRLDPEADIADPIGLDRSVYDSLAGRLKELIAARLEEQVGS